MQSGLPEEKLPKDFGKYRLVKKIATGGMAEIFLAHRADEPQPLVVKRILPHLAESSEFVSMFLDEARIAAQLNHPNIVQIHDVGQIGGAYYISMEYIRGEDVRRIYNQAYKLQRSLPLSHSIRVIAEAALGLDFAHRLPDLSGRPMGVVHRDVSPQNILVTYEGGVKVVDFGIAKAANKVNQTRAGVLKGKYSYMSPEQALGESIDHRTDIFALGIILYETTTGTRLFKRQSELATLQAVMKCELTPPSDALPGYPIELEQIVLRALAKDPSDRYQSAQELSDDLFHFLDTSGLFVGPDAISEFMHDLFADRLAEEAAAGHAVFPQEHEIKAEMVPRNPSVAASGVDEGDAIAAPVATPEGDVPSLTDDTALSPNALATFADEPPSEPRVQHAAAAVLPPGFMGAEEQSNDGTVPEEDHEDILRPSKRVEAARPRSAAPVAVTNAQRPGREKGAADQLPTQVAQQAYKEPKQKVRLIEPEKPERSAVVEQTELVRAHAPKRHDTVPLGSPPPNNAPSPVQKEAPRRTNGVGPKSESLRTRPTNVAPEQRAPRWVIVLGVVSVFCLGLGVALVGMWSRAQNKDNKPPAAAVDPGPAAEAGFGEVNIVTEPSAQIWSANKVLGQADASGVAGPFSLPAGERTLRVTIPERGFERERSVIVRSGGIHEIDIKSRPGWLKLAVAPWAQIRVDGRDEGITPLPNIHLDEGVHQIELENPDLKRRHKATVRVKAGEVVELKIDLTKTGEPM